MNSGLWEEFTNSVAYNLNLNKISASSIQMESLENSWHKMQTSISKAALSNIPNKRFKASNFQHQYTSKATNLYQDLKALGSIIQTIKKLLVITCLCQII